MAAIVIRRSHSMEMDQLKVAVGDLLDAFSAEHPGLIKGVDWNGAGTEAKAKGKGFSAVFSMDGSSVEVKVELSLLARAFKGRVEDGLTRKMDEILGSA